MENLNNLIWTDEISTCCLNPDPRPMRELCIVAFCSSDSSGIIDTAGSFYGCGIDAIFRTIACLSD